VSLKDKETVKILEKFREDNHPCCAGCDWWRWINAVLGECHKSSPVSGRERADMLGITAYSFRPKAGHVLTRRDHHCGNFEQEQ